jgi:hypothetical protein
MKADALKVLIRLAERRERASVLAVASRRRALDEAIQLRQQAQLKMERASFKAESERLAQARIGSDVPVTAARLREGHEYGYLLLWKALAEFSEVRKADVVLAERRSDLAQALSVQREMMRRRQKLEAMHELVRSREADPFALLEGEG